MGFNHFWNMLTLGLCLLNAPDTKTKQNFLFKNKAFVQSQECPGSTVLSLPPSTEGISGLRWLSGICYLEVTVQVKPAGLGQAPTVCGRNLGDSCRRALRATHRLCRQTRPTWWAVPCHGESECDAGVGGSSQAVTLLCVKSDDSEWGHWGSLPRGDRSEFIGKRNLESARGTELRAAGATVNWGLETGASRCVRGTVVQDVHIVWEVGKSPHGTSVYNKQPWMMRPSSVLQDRVSTSWFSH